MSFSKRLLLILFRALTGSIFRIHGDALTRVPAHGPLIIVMNHVNILELPLIYSQLQPRTVRGLVLADRWKNSLLALKSKAPLLPVVTVGGECYQENHKRLHRTDLTLAVGEPFSLKADEAAFRGPARKVILDEIMYRLAVLLPPDHRGVYAHLEAATEQFLAFDTTQTVG